MEDETGFLSKDDENKTRIQELLIKVLQDLNQNQVTTIVEGETTIYLKIVNLQPDPQPVLDHMVPRLRSFYDCMSLDIWDLTTQQVLPYINGITHIAKIAAESDVENALVKACIQNLVYYGVVSI